ncbi:uncharacterized protein PG986_006400 [Apiospora aurea]|uniref:tripeptidyl-peptidase II n=1 Tax=Apiospora aurea TaxID=335848 RepID=A0ABR1QKP1_9PEZI
MGRFAVAFLALLAPTAVVSSPIKARTPYQVKETHHAPRGWKRVERASADQVMNIQIGLKQSNFEELERHLYEVSDPAHARYGQHLSQQEVKDLVKPSDEALDLVHEWLQDNGVAPAGYSTAKDWISVTLPVDKIESLLDTKYHTYEHADGSRVARTSKWSLPAHLHDHIDTIQPTTSFFRARAERFDHVLDAGWIPPAYTPPSNSTLNKVCNISSVTPECFQTLYGTKGYKTRAADVNKVGFTNYLGEHPIRSDTEKFLAKYHPEAVSSARDFKQFTIANGPGDGPITQEELADGTDKEANLDVQAIAGISWGTPIESYSTGGSPPFIPSQMAPDNTNEPYLVWLDYLLSQPSIPQVISTSYSDDEQTVPRSYANRVCQEFARAGARGTSILFSSGDDGVGPDGGVCVSNDGKNTTQFLPGFPSSCPYVTTIGATMKFQPEVVAYRPPFDRAGKHYGAYTSGGGFSNYFEAPKYQKQVTEAYVKSLNGTFDGLYNKKGRGYPDISAQGMYFAYFYNGTEGTISGTSASCPLTGGIISLLNDARIASGMPPMGFLNPWIYSVGRKGVNDITSGSAHGCDTAGFPAQKGWDPVTGFGTPIFPELVKLAGASFS